MSGSDLSSIDDLEAKVELARLTQRQFPRFESGLRAIASRKKAEDELRGRDAIQFWNLLSGLIDAKFQNRPVTVGRAREFIVGLEPLTQSRYISAADKIGVAKKRRSKEDRRVVTLEPTPEAIKLFDETLSSWLAEYDRVYRLRKRRQ